MLDVRVTMAAPPPPTPPAGMPWEVARRLITNLVLGAALLAWLRAYTDYGDSVLTLLALGGILSWAAVVAKLFTAERQEQIRRVLADYLFESRRADATSAVLFVVLVLTGLFGSLEVVNLQGGDARVRVYSAGGLDPGSAGEERIAAGGRDRTLLWAVPPEYREMTVAAVGLPTTKVTVRPWWLSWGAERVAVPGSFLRPGVLILTTDSSRVPPPEGTLVIRVKVNDVEVYSKPYTRAVLVRAKPDPGENAFNPTEALREYRLDPDVVTYVSSPAEAHHDLKPGSRVVAEVFRAKDPHKVVIEQVEVAPVRWPERDGIQVAFLK